MNIFKKARRTSPLSKDDVRILLNQKSHGSLSRIESGKRLPSKNIVIGYHVLFGTPLNDLLKSEIEQYQQDLEGFVEVRIGQLLEKGNIMETSECLIFLEHILEHEPKQNNE